MFCSSFCTLSLRRHYTHPPVHHAVLQFRWMRRARSAEPTCSACATNICLLLARLKLTNGGNRVDKRSDARKWTLIQMGMRCRQQWAGVYKHTVTSTASCVTCFLELRYIDTRYMKCSSKGTCNDHAIVTTDKQMLPMALLALLALNQPEAMNLRKETEAHGYPSAWATLNLKMKVDERNVALGTTLT